MESTATARAFMNGKAGRLHPALNMKDAQHDPLRDKYVSTNGSTSKISASAVQHTQHFITIMNIVLNNSSVSGFDLRASHTWVDVRLAAGAAAQKQYQDKAKGLKGIFPRLGRKIGEMNPAIEAFAQNLPCGDYTSLVCGGIVLFFKAFNTVQKVRENVLNTLGDYPELLDTVERLLKLYPHEKRLEAKAVELYIALLIAVEGMIEWFEEKTWERFKAFWQQGLYARSLTDKISHLKKCGTALKTEADICDKERGHEVFAALQSTVLQLSRIEDDVLTLGDDIAQRFEDLQIQLAKRDQDHAIEVKNSMLDIFTQIEKSREVEWEKRLQEKERAAREAQQRYEAQTKAAQIEYEARVKEAEVQAEAQRLQLEHLQQELLLQQAEAARRHQPLTAEYIIQHLQNGFGRPTLAAAYYIKYSRMQNSDDDITPTVMGDAKFRAWYASAVSQSLLVIPPVSTSKASAGSFMAAALYDSLATRTNAVTMGFFCSRDIANRDEEPVVITLLRSLIVQLLEAYDYDQRTWTEKAGSYEHQENLAYRDTTYLCSLFKYLIRSSPHGAIFCIIEDLRTLERCAPQETLRQVLDMFQELSSASSETQSAAFKLIWFSPELRGQIVKQTARNGIIRVAEERRQSDDSFTTPTKVLTGQLESIRTPPSAARRSSSKGYIASTQV